ncbi:hypothetical protein PsorP6_006035 [Peronosclerospora sorghi]|uniref:Uncharacterized protein n=1 Tax=Peronosclerospora sorghi TaxID=230839 RepID=A0ACC0W4Z8_9STRA|nr:hypothetical protein PsorP6_006035 [Peronosclerospora sorghi]
MRQAATLIATISALVAASYAVEVSICGDATYDLPEDRGVICSSADPTPPGTACPLKGDKASAHCSGNLPSYNHGICVAPEDAVCALVTNRTWGCVLPSVGCNTKLLPEVPAPQCDTWDYEERSSIDLESLYDGKSNFHDSWFVEKTKVTVLFACETDNPTAAPTPEPTPCPTPEPTPAPTLDCSDSSYLESTPDSTSVCSEALYVESTETTDSLASKPTPDVKSELSLSSTFSTSGYQIASAPALTSGIEDSPGVVHTGGDLASGTVDSSSFTIRPAKNSDVKTTSRPGSVDALTPIVTPTAIETGNYLSDVSIETEAVDDVATKTSESRSVSEDCGSTPTKQSAEFTNVAPLLDPSNFIGTLKPASTTPNAYKKPSRL